jgi:hypothetical protein
MLTHRAMQPLACTCAHSALAFSDSTNISIAPASRARSERAVLPATMFAIAAVMMNIPTQQKRSACVRTTHIRNRHEVQKRYAGHTQGAP